MKEDHEKNKEELKQQLEPVSYTHLDVYKRQALWQCQIFPDNHMSSNYMLRGNRLLQFRYIESVQPK